MSRFFVSVFLIRLLSVFCFAEEALQRVTFDNGDVITGTLVSEDETSVRLQVDYLGEVVIQRDRIVDLSRVESMVLVTKEVDETAAKPDPAGEGEEPVDEEPDLSEVTTVSKERSGREETITEVVVVKAPEPEEGILRGFLNRITESAEAWSPLPEWDKRLQFGLNASSGRRNQTTLNYRLDMQRKFEESQLNLNAEYSYGQADDATTLNKLLTRMRWRKDISPGVFYESQSVYSWDQIKLIDSNVEQKLGLGTRLVESDASTLSAGLGASGRWREFTDNTDEVAYLVDLFQDWDYRMSERISLRQDFKLAMPLEDNDEYEMNFSAAVTSEVTDSINLSVRYEFGFDNSLAEPLKEDRRFVSSLGYSF